MVVGPVHSVEEDDPEVEAPEGGSIAPAAAAVAVVMGTTRARLDNSADGAWAEAETLPLM